MILLKGEMADSDPRDIITLVLMEEWIKALENIGTTNGRTIMIPSSPGQLGEFGDQIRNLLLGVVEAAKGNGLPELTVGSEPVSGSEDSAPPA